MSHKISLGIIIFLAIMMGVGATIFVRTNSIMPQSTYSLFQNLPEIKSTDRLLIIAPHQDDEALGAGGLIQQALEAKATVKVVFATDGNKHDLKDVRHAEAIKVDGILGLKESDLTFFDFPDGDLVNRSGFSEKLDSFIEIYQPSIVVTTMPEDSHPDHAACGRVALDAWQDRQSFQLDFFLVHSHRFPKPSGYHFGSYILPPIRFINAEYNWVTSPLSPAQEQTKETAIRAYKSQIEIKNPILRELMLSFIRRNELFAVPRQ